MTREAGLRSAVAATASVCAQVAGAADDPSPRCMAQLDAPARGAGDEPRVMRASSADCVLGADEAFVFENLFSDILRIS
eukprot:5748200-Pleurochrysis_carterae.AAC.2